MSRAGFSYLTKYLSKSTEYKKDDSKSVITLALCWFFRERSFSVSGHLSKLYSDLIKQLNSISNLTCDFTVGFDNSTVCHGVVEWSLYGFVRGFVDGWSDNWHDISKEELEKLEIEGLLERTMSCFVG
jgi:hypothetical protein